MAWVTKDSQEGYQPEEPKKEYTKKEQRQNWWLYHKWIVLGCVLAAVLVGMMIKDIAFQVKPDYQIAWVGQSELPEDTSAALTSAFQNLCDDRNGDGQVVVQLNQFTVSFSETSTGESADTAEADAAVSDAATGEAAGTDMSMDANMQMAGVTKMSADMSSTDGSYIYIIQNPDGFQRYTSILQYLDGTQPDREEEATDWENMVYRWSDCPALTALDLGTCSNYTKDDGTPLENQLLMEGAYIGRRGLWDDKQAESHDAYNTLWDTITAGAVKLPGAAK